MKNIVNTIILNAIHSANITWIHEDSAFCWQILQFLRRSRRGMGKGEREKKKRGMVEGRQF